jgi:bifunctional DNA-binding transcriptional regulator/antitoxin component of YhaV-PrlF toxin-antitoxin module
MIESTLTERGQISVPMKLRKALQLKPGQRFAWQQVSDREIRMTLIEDGPAIGPVGVLGYARRLRSGAPRRTADWMQEIRSGESD